MSYPVSTTQSMKQYPLIIVVAINYVTWTTKPVISTRYICSNSQKYIVWVKIIDFYFMPKIIRILRKDHVPWRYLVHFLRKYIKNNFWSVICIAKNFIWTILKAIFSILWFFYTQIFKYCISAKYCPILTHHASTESFQMMYKSQ